MIPNKNRSTKIVCRSSDSVIWDKEHFLFDLIKAASQGDVTIDMNFEGPCCESLGLNDIIQLLTAKYGYDLNQFRLENINNQLHSSIIQETRTHHVGTYVSKVRDFFSTSSCDSTLQKKFAIFVSRSNWIRLGLASYLWNRHRDKTWITFHYDNANEFHRANLGIEEFLQRYPDHKYDVVKFWESLPMVYDKVTTYPINFLDAWCSMADLYRHLFCEIVCETFFSGKTFCMTEKVCRPILYKRPFIIQGPKYFLKNLHLLGFRTFDQWWDEGYDQDHHDSRFQTITHNIEWIASQAPATIDDWYQEMKPILEHNFNTLMSLTDQKMLKTEFYHE